MEGRVSERVSILGVRTVGMDHFVERGNTVSWLEFGNVGADLEHVSRRWWIYAVQGISYLIDVSCYVISLIVAFDPLRDFPVLGIAPTHFSFYDQMVWTCWFWYRDILNSQLC